MWLVHDATQTTNIAERQALQALLDNPTTNNTPSAFSTNNLRYPIHT